MSIYKGAAEGRQQRKFIDCVLQYMNYQPLNISLKKLFWEVVERIEMQFLKVSRRSNIDAVKMEG